MIDVGYTKKINPSWERHADRIDYLLSFNPMIESFNLEKHCHLQLAITNEHNSQPMDFNIYRKGACSSLFKVDRKILDIRPGDPKDMDLIKTVKVGCVRLDELLCTMDTKFNYLKIDTQGSDLAVIESIEEYLKDLWAIEAEVFFERFYEGAPMCDEICGYLGRTKYFKFVRNLRKPNNLFGDYLFVNINAPVEFLKFMERIYKCKILSV